MSEYVCPGCGRADQLAEEGEVMVTGWRDVRYRVEHGKLQMETGPVETTPHGFDVEFDLFEHTPRQLGCACGWAGAVGELIQVGWDGPVQRPLPGQLALKEVAA